MPEPFKNFFNPELVGHMADQFTRQRGSFDKQLFLTMSLDNFDQLELKERSNQIAAALKASLPGDFRQACAILTGSLRPTEEKEQVAAELHPAGVGGWAVMPMCDYVADAGIDDFDFAMDVLKEMTKRSSAEFAVRPLLTADMDRAMKHVERWSTDKSLHVRRLASEGIRPRLPWGMRLSMFVEDPAPILPILETLKDDPEEYVRRSVANNLNDIAKDHPDIVAAIARQWLSGSPDKNRVRLVRHACRSLIKSGHQPTLDALGYKPAQAALYAFELNRDTVGFGESIEFSAQLKSTADHDQDLIIDYIIHHQKANGTTTPKVFKWKNARLSKGAGLGLKKTHAFKAITTRKYHPGRHIIEIQANGKSLGRKEFILTM